MMASRIRVTMQAKMEEGKRLYHRNTTKAEAYFNFELTFKVSAPAASTITLPNGTLLKLFTHEFLNFNPVLAIHVPLYLPRLKRSR